MRHLLLAQRFYALGEHRNAKMGALLSMPVICPQLSPYRKPVALVRHEGEIAARYCQRDVIHGAAKPRHKQLRAVKILSVKAVAELRRAAKRAAYKYRVFIIGYSHTYS